jgi:hypothetical protein
MNIQQVKAKHLLMIHSVVQLLLPAHACGLCDRNAKQQMETVTLKKFHQSTMKELFCLKLCFHVASGPIKLKTRAGVNS